MGVDVLVGCVVAVGGSGVLLGIAVGWKPGGIAVGLLQDGGSVWVGKITATEVMVGLKRAVMVKSGVGNTNGVGEATKGKLQASIESARTARLSNGKRIFFLTLSSHQ